MTKKKPSPQNRIWEKERRDRLNSTFDNLSKLLPEYEPATQLSKIEILQRAIEFVEKLQNQIKASLEERDALLKKHVDELEERLQILIARNEDLAALLKKANINVPPCKLGPLTSGKDSPVEKQVAPTVDSTKLDNQPSGKPVEENGETEVSVRKTETVSSGSVPVSTSVITTNGSCSNASDSSITVSSASDVSTKNSAVITAIPTMVATSLPSNCLVLANNHIVGTLNQSNGVNVTPALLPTPIMTTGVIISNNGNLLQMPLTVPPTSSLLIVRNEDVRSKLSLRKTRGSGRKSASTRGSSYRKGKFTIKSIDVIPGRIVNGKIPIPPLKRSPVSAEKAKKEPRKKRRKRKVSEQKENQGVVMTKLVKLDEKKDEVIKDIEHASEQIQKKTPVGNLPTENIEQIQENQVVQLDEQANSLEMNLDQGDLSADIFANLQVPDDAADGDQGSLSPTAAYLMNFPLVSTGGKASGNHVDCVTEPETVECGEADKKTSLQTTDSTLLLDNFSSYFNPSMYSTLDNVIQPIAETPTTSATTTNFATSYQSIDSMLEHKPSRVTVASDCRYNATPFTFTLTSTSNTVSSQSYDYRLVSSSSNYFYSTANTTKPIDDFGLLKPSIATDFTFSLTSTIQSGPRTVQSQYTNSTIFSSTITTPSYSIYGSQTKTSKVANYNSNYIPDVSKSEPTQTPKKYDFLEAEKPATSFTFSLTSTTKTTPKYTYPQPVASCSSYTAPFITTSASTCSKVDDCLYKSAKSSSTSHHNLYKTPPKQKIVHYSAVPTTQPSFQNQTSTHSQSKYDVNWMTSQDPKPSSSLQDYNQVLPSLDFNAAPSHSYQTNIDLSRKSDIFFAHPSGEDNLVTWSPNKLTNILNDTNSSYYPSTATSLPSLHGDLALNCPPTANKLTNQQRKPNDSSSTFLSVQQLVDQPRKSSTTNKNYASCGNYSSNQKPLNNNYSAEALIGPSTGSSTKKDKYYTETGYNTYSSFQPEPSSGAGLAFNFDYSTDYGKNYNYSCQQNYMPSFVDNSYGLSTVPSATLTTPSSSSFPVTTAYTSYGYSSDRKPSTSTSTGYYQNSYQPDIPYYVPSTEKRPHTSTKPRKHHKQPAPNDFSTFPAILPTAPPMPTLPEDPLFYNPITTVTTTTTAYQQLPPYQSNLPNYSFSGQPYSSSAPSALIPAAAAGGSSSSTLTNFNLSTICPEINEKSGGGSAANNGGPGTAAVATVIGGSVSSRHVIAGVGGW